MSRIKCLHKQCTNNYDSFAYIDTNYREHDIFSCKRQTLLTISESIRI